MKFINREKELNNLNQAWKSKKAQFFIIYGKRRVGKTELIKQFTKNKSGIYYLADKRTSKEQLKELGQIVGEYYKDEILKNNGFSDWLEFFSYIKNKSKKEPLVIAIDEYPYLVENNKEISSLFQKAWDNYLKDTKVFLILCGSSISMMEKETLIFKSPLFGRRTGQLLIEPLNFFQAWQFFPEKSFDDFLNIYSICGGMPAYLQQFKSSEKFENIVKEKILNSSSFLYNEIEFMLKEELREPKNYLAILKAIAYGQRKLGKIVNEVGLEKNILNKYLNVLLNLKLIERQVPVTEKLPNKSRKGLYKIADNFTLFWFYFIFPFKSYLALDNYDFVLKKIFGNKKYSNSQNSNFKLIVSKTYEQVAMEILYNLKNEIFEFEKIDSWWLNEEEIDLVAFNEKEKRIIFGECKWSEKPIGIDTYLNLKRKSQLVNWYNNERVNYYILFSKSGFTKNIMKLATEENIFLVEKNKLICTKRKKLPEKSMQKLRVKK